MPDSDATDGFRSRFKDFFLNKKYTDVTIHVKGEDETISIQSHKTLLIMSSLVFQNLLIPCPGSELTIEEPQIKNFQVLIEFIYTHDIDFSNLKSKDVITIIQLAIKYKIPELVKYCVERVFKQKHLSELCCKKCLADYFNLALKENIEIMIKPCLEIISQHTASFFMDDAVLSLSPEAVRTIVEQDDLNISEIELYSSVVSWVILTHSRGIYEVPMHTRQCEIPFNLQLMENKALCIVKVEHSDLEMTDKLELDNLYTNASRLLLRHIHHIEFEETRDHGNIQSEMNRKMFRKILDKENITQCIRFLALDSDEFDYICANNNILTTDEVSDISLTRDSTCSLQSGLSNNRIPRRVKNFKVPPTSSKLRVHACMMFKFLSDRTYQVDFDRTPELLETFVVESEQPILLTAIVLPPKLTFSDRYEEDVFVKLYRRKPGAESQLFASTCFIGRRRCEPLTLLINYDVDGLDGDICLHRGSEIDIEIRKLTRGAYKCFSNRLCQNPFIVPKGKKNEFIIGFGFCFNMG